MKIYFTRHGESQANILRIISNRDLPHGLTETGRRQALELADKLRGRPISHIYSSPIPRAYETAEILSEELGVKMENEDALREPDCGVLEGRGDAEAWDEHNYWSRNWFIGSQMEYGPDGGESCQDVRNRLTKFLNDLILRYGGTESEFLLVAHGFLIMYGLSGFVAGVDPQTVLERGLGHTVLITTELQEGKLVCLAWEPI